jgi:YHS domain-containing protein/mono/diheme cytochrome c family protein
VRELLQAVSAARLGRMKHGILAGSSLSLLASLSFASPAKTEGLADLAIARRLVGPAAVAEVDYLKDVQPIFEENCWSCHGPKKKKGGLRLDTKAGLFEGEEDYIPVVPGKPDSSYMLELVCLPADDPDIMPAKGDPLTKEQIATLRQWITEGAEWTELEHTPEAKPETLDLPALTPAQRGAVDAAVSQLLKAGVRVVPSYSGTDALEANFALLRDKVDSDTVRQIAGLEPVLVHADFSRTGIDDRALEALGACGELRHLNLSRTKVTGAGVAALEGLQHLRYLNLYGTQVGDDAVAVLASLPSLEKLFLWQAPISDEAVARLLEQRPGLQVIRGQALVTAAPIEAVNKKCPVMGEDIDPAQFSTVQNQRVAFCCAKCKAAFDAKPADFLDKVDGFVATASAKEAAGTDKAGDVIAAIVVVNKKCPVSGQAVDASQVSVVQEQGVGFCCAKCKKTFDAKPADFLSKIDGFVPAQEPGDKADDKSVKATAVNAKCPVSGQAVVAAQFSVVQDQRVAFCCGKCKKAFDAKPGDFLNKIDGFVPVKKAE